MASTLYELVRFGVTNDERDRLGLRLEDVIPEELYNQTKVSRYDIALR